jgi:uncharacterized protein (TIRG00374 family)
MPDQTLAGGGMLVSASDHSSGAAERPKEDLPSLPGSPGRPDLRQLFLIALLAMGAYLLLPQLAGVGDAILLLEQLSPQYVGAALALQTISVLSHAHVVQQTLRIFETSVRFVTLLEISLASGFATLLVPSVGLSGLALRCRYLGERGCSLDATTVAFTIEAVGQAAAHTAMTAIAFTHRVTQGRQPPWASLALVLLVLLLGTATLVMLLANPAKRDWRFRLLHTVNRFRRRRGQPIITDDVLEHRLTELQLSVTNLSASLTVRLIIGNMCRNLASALALYVTLMALNQRVPLSSVVLSYSFADVLGGVSSLPAGLLVTETSLSALLNRAGVPISAAVAATLVFRFISVWLPRAIGLFAWIDLQRRSKRPLWS